MGMKVEDTLFIANNDFASIKNDTIKSAKIIKKDREYLTSAYPLKFNDTQIKLDLNGIILIKKSHVGQILLVSDYVVDFTSSRMII